MIPATHLTPAAHAELLAISRSRAEALQHRRDLAERVPSFEVYMLDEQRHARALQEIAYRNDQLRRPPSVFGDLA